MHQLKNKILILVQEDIRYSVIRYVASTTVMRLDQVFLILELEKLKVM
jgi:hypothetical protein